MTPAQAVQQIYDAFGRGDVPAILQHLAEDVEWEYSGKVIGVPWLEPRRGRSEVPKFFASMAGFELHRFQPKTFLAQGNIVAVLIDIDFTVKSTGRRVTEEDEIHLWHFDGQGRVAKFTHKLDTHEHWLACGHGTS